MEQTGDCNTVLFVEDEVLVRLSVADALRQAGLTVLEAANADEARTILASGVYAIGVVVTGTEAPRSIDGAALLRHARQRHPQIGIVILSAAPANVPNAVDADLSLAKPHSAQRLIKEIQHLLAARCGNGSRKVNAGYN